MVDTEETPAPQAENLPTPPTPPPEEIDTAKQAEKVKEEGNVAFKAQKFHDAIGSYTRAIGECFVLSAYVLRRVVSTLHSSTREVGRVCTSLVAQRLAARDVTYTESE